MIYEVLATRSVDFKENFVSEYANPLAKKLRDHFSDSTVYVDYRYNELTLISYIDARSVGKAKDKLLSFIQENISGDLSAGWKLSAVKV